MATGCDGEEAEEEEEEEGSHKLSSTPHQKKKKKLLTQTPPTKTSVSDAFLSPGVLLEVGKRGRGKQRPTRGTRASMHPTNARPTNIPSRQGKMGEGSDTVIEAGVTIFFYLGTPRRYRSEARQYWSGAKVFRGFLVGSAMLYHILCPVYVKSLHLIMGIRNIDLFQN